MEVQQELESLGRVRQLKGEPRVLYLCRIVRAASLTGGLPADSLSPRAYAWLRHAQARLQSGNYPLDFDDPNIDVSVSDQLFDLLEAEDSIAKEKAASRNTSLRKPTKEARSGDYMRIAQYILLYPGASLEATSASLASTGWIVSRKKVERVQDELRRAMLALKESGFTVHGPDGSRIIGI